MKKSITRILFLAFVVVTSLSFAVFAYSNQASTSDKEQSDTQSVSVTQEDIEDAIESVNQEIRDTVPVDSSQFSETSLSELSGNGRVYLRSNSTDLSSTSVESFKGNWMATAYMQIQEEAPVGSTYPLVYMSDDQKTMMMLYKNPDGSIVKKVATYQEPKGQVIDLYQMYRISETEFSGKQLPEIMKVQ